MLWYRLPLSFQSNRVSSLSLSLSPQRKMHLSLKRSMNAKDFKNQFIWVRGINVGGIICSGTHVVLHACCFIASVERDELCRIISALLLLSL